MTGDGDGPRSSTRNGLTDFSEAVVPDFDIRLFPVRRGRELLDALGEAAGGVVDMTVGAAAVIASFHTGFDGLIDSLAGFYIKSGIA